MTRIANVLTPVARIMSREWFNVVAAYVLAGVFMGYVTSTM